MRLGTDRSNQQSNSLQTSACVPRTAAPSFDDQLQSLLNVFTSNVFPFLTKLYEMQFLESKTAWIDFIMTNGDEPNEEFNEALL